MKIADPKHPGKYIAKKIDVVKHFRNVRQAVVDPINVGQVRIIDVAVQVEAPPVKPEAAINNAQDILQKHITLTKGRIKHLSTAIRNAKKRKADSPILEDGAPAPPFRQDVEAANELYKILEPDMKKAKQIGERYLEEARDQILFSSNNHQMVADFNDKMNEEFILPENLNRH